MSTGENWKLLQANLEEAGGASKTYIARHWMPYGPGKMPAWGVTGEESLAQSLTVTTQVPASFSLAPEILVTSAMIDAGREAWSRSIEQESSSTTYELVYRAMAALAPVEIVSEGERHSAIELDNERMYREAAERENVMLRADRDEVWDTVRKFNNYAKELERETFDLREHLAAREARIAELDSRLAAFTAANVPDTTTEPAHNPFQPFTGDPRRMGR